MINVDYDHAMVAMKNSVDISGLGYVDLYVTTCLLWLATSPAEAARPVT